MNPLRENTGASLPHPPGRTGDGGRCIRMFGKKKCEAHTMKVKSILEQLQRAFHEENPTDIQKSKSFTLPGWRVTSACAAAPRLRNRPAKAIPQPMTPLRENTGASLPHPPGRTGDDGRCIRMFGKNHHLPICSEPFFKHRQ